MLLGHENLIQVTPLQTVHTVVWNIAQVPSLALIRSASRSGQISHLDLVRIKF